MFLKNLIRSFLLTISHRCLSLRSAVRRCVLLWGRSSSSTICHGLDIGSVYERLMEVADTACDIDVARDRQRNKWL